MTHIIADSLHLCGMTCDTSRLPGMYGWYWISVTLLSGEAEVATETLATL